MKRVDYNTAIIINFMNVDDIEEFENLQWPEHTIFSNNFKES